MTKRVTYIADDGTEFKDECECFDYELSLKAKGFADSAFMLSSQGNPLPLVEYSYETVRFIIAKTQEAADFLYELADGKWFTPWHATTVKPGGWALMCEDEWVSMEELASAHQMLAKYF